MTTNNKFKVIIGTADSNGYDWNYRTELMTEAEYQEARSYRNNLYSVNKAK